MTRMRFYYRVARFACQIIFLLLFRGRAFGVHRVPRSGAVLLVCNHQSVLDPPLAAVRLPRECSFMARHTLFRGGWTERVIRYLNAFPVKRDSADIGAMREAIRRLKAGQLVTVFPEGTRSTDGAIGPMHAGTVLLARRARAPMAPAAVIGAYHAWPRGQRWPRLVPLRVAYGKLLTFDELAKLSDEEAMAEIRARIAELYARYALRDNPQRPETRTS